MFHEYLHVWSSQNCTVRQGHIFHAYVEVPVVNAVTSRGRGKNGLYPDTVWLIELMIVDSIITTAKHNV